jgi:hypothetical protein
MATRPLESKFQIYHQEGSRDSNLYKSIDAAAVYQVFPHLVDFEMLEPTRRRMAAYSRSHIIGEDGSLMRVFEDKAAIQDVSADYIQWRLYTENADIRTFFNKNYEPVGAQSGLGNQIFEIGLDTDNMGPNDIFVFEDYRDFPLIVKSDPQPDGDTFKYEVELWTSDVDYIELDLVGVGKRVIQIGSIIGEATVRRGNVTLNAGNAFIDFEVPMTRMGWSMEVTDKAWKNAKDFVLEATDPDVKQALTDGLGSPKKIIYDELDTKFYRATNRQIDMWLTYGKSADRFASQFLDGLTQRQLDAGPGLYEFLDSAWKDEYPVEGGSLDIFRNFLKRIWLNKVDTNERVVHAYTGSAGLELIQKWCRAEDIDPVEQPPELHYNMKEGYDSNKQGVVIGKKQYVGFEIQPFGTVYFHYMPFLDNTAVDSRTYKGYPYSSYQFMIFDFGYGDIREGANIKILRDQGYENFGYGIGTWSPFGPALNDPRANQFRTTMANQNAYEIIRETAMGFLIHDVSNVLFMQPAIS